MLTKMNDCDILEKIFFMKEGFKMNEAIYNLISEISAFDFVESVVIGGSRASGYSDKLSDYDIYVYCTKKLDKSDDEYRKSKLEELCSYAEFGNEYWEHEDNIILKDGTKADIIYRQFENIGKLMDYQFNEGYAFNSYTTCFWFNILHTEIIYDKNGKYKELQQKCNIPYPEKLRKNIIERSKNLLFDKLPAFDVQIEKAYERNDIISVNHRITEFLASYSDMIFALNRLPHPGEKRILTYAKEKCTLLPENFEKNIVDMLSSFQDKEKTLNAMHNIVAEIKILLTEQKEI